MTDRPTWWTPEDEEEYGDELASCEAGLDRLHPPWRDTVPFDKMPLQPRSRVQMLLKRWHMITHRNGHHGLVLGYKLARKDNRPVKAYACVRKARYDEYGQQQYGPEFVQLIAPPVFADRAGVPLDDAIAGLAAYEQAVANNAVTERRPRKFVAEHIKARAKAAKAAARRTRKEETDEAA